MIPWLMPASRLPCYRTAEHPDKRTGFCRIALPLLRLPHHLLMGVGICEFLLHLAF
nr:MAG TPA: hypothetical protein [Caudoviricetes sp.]